jgi:Domain of Unknown Function with PDB structure (DUF3857)
VKRIFLGLILVGFAREAKLQDMNVPFGKVTRADLDMKVYEKDTSANAVVLDELGTAFISDEINESLVYQRYVKIKILRKAGLEESNFELYLQKSEKYAEELIDIQGSTYHVREGVVSETKLDRKNVFKEDAGRYRTLVKFALPDVQEGSVIEVKYKINSPFLFNFYPWNFQADIPKVRSEYWAKIPANYQYNIAIRGFLKPTRNEVVVTKECYNAGFGSKADCAFYKWGFDEVPGFVEEDYMTAKKNFLSSIYFEPSQVTYFDGRVDKMTKEWKDVDDELRNLADFGIQLKKARNVMDDPIKPAIQGKTTDLDKAKAIFDFVKYYYQWDDTRGMFTDKGVKQAFDTKKGNVAEINLSLVGALQSAGLKANPVILSTRDHGLPIEVHPVISDFNYVLGAVDIGGTLYFLDATNDLNPFGFLPLTCINGKGRLIGNPSTWVELTPRDKNKTAVTVKLSLGTDGLHGTLAIVHAGYDALNKRTEILTASSQEAYVSELQNSWKGMEISHYQNENLDSLEKPLIEKMDITVEIDLAGGRPVYFSPFIFEDTKWDSNPFRSADRLYPVDFGAPLEEVLNLNLTYPEGYTVDELPASAALALPQKGGRYLFNVANLQNQINITSNFTINKPVYTSVEYHSLKELFARIVNIQQSQLVLKRK